MRLWSVWAEQGRDYEHATSGYEQLCGFHGVLGRQPCASEANRRLRGFAGRYAGARSSAQTCCVSERESRDADLRKAAEQGAVDRCGRRLLGCGGSHAGGRCRVDADPTQQDAVQSHGGGCRGPTASRQEDVNGLHSATTFSDAGTELCASVHDKDRCSRGCGSITASMAARAVCSAHL